MIPIKLTLAFIVLHFIADFVFQAEEWAVTKSKDFRNLLKHTGTYTAVWFGVFIFWCFHQSVSGFNAGDFGLTWKVFLFFPITFVCHTVTDYITSRKTSRLYAAKKFGSPIPNFGFFTVIGFDQVLHYVQLFLTYQFVMS